MRRTTRQQVARELDSAHRLGPPHAGAVFEGMPGGACRAVAPSADWAYFSLGEEIPPAAFVELTPALR